MAGHCLIKVKKYHYPIDYAEIVGDDRCDRSVSKLLVVTMTGSGLKSAQS
jgi:hypothetical protein